MKGKNMCTNSPPDGTAFNARIMHLAA